MDEKEDDGPLTTELVYIGRFLKKGGVIVFSCIPAQVGRQCTHRLTGSNE